MHWSGRLHATLLVALVTLFPALALGAGRVQWTKTTLEERDDKSWKIEVAIFLPKPPDVPHVSMKFEFQQTVYYERSMMDGDKLVERKVPMENKQPLIESVDVGFLDPSSGQVQSRTKFTFRVTRAHGYEAGEYRVTIRDGRNGNVIGTPTKLIFAGNNEIIDRRAMVFSSEGGKKKSQMRQVDRDGNVVDGGASEAGTAKQGSTEEEPAAAEEPQSPPA